VTSVQLRRGIARGTVRPPGSKSISNRALIAAALSPGTSKLSGLLLADDTEVMLAALQRMGVGIVRTEAAVVVTGIEKFNSSSLNVEASGTTMRFLAGLAGVADAVTQLDGTKRMRERPIGSLVDALRMLGVNVEYLGQEGFPPVSIRGSADHAPSVTVDASESSQFVTAIMLAAPFHGGGVELRFKDGVSTSRTYLQTTIEVMAAFGIRAELFESKVVVHSGRYRAAELEIEPDASSAVFLWGAAAVTGGSVLATGFAQDSTQSDLGVLDVMSSMGCEVDRGPAGIRVSGPHQLRGVVADLSGCPDAALMLAAAAVTASGPTTLTGLHTLRLKETDRLDALHSELTNMGADVTIRDDDALHIVPGPYRPADIATYDDHRMAMAFGALSLGVDGLTIQDPGCVSKTWPRFWQVLDAINTNRVVAIDGHAGVGKTSVSTAVAHDLGYTRLDTGALYRAVTVLGMTHKVDLSSETALVAALDEFPISFEAGHILLGEVHICSEIRNPIVSRNVSEVSAHPGVRSRMVAYQRSWVESQNTGVVAEGRDMGTVVFPDASVKIFLSARPEIRAARRATELDGNVSAIAEEMAERDRKDSTREISPTRIANDAVEIDTSDVTIEAVVSQVVELARS
jgi:3-phosphoshikimate 1-carboxyvinyltransferase